MLDQAMFDDDCEAWVHGAVYPNVYSVFRQFKYAPLPSVEETFEFGEQEQRILNAVKKYYFDIYKIKLVAYISFYFDIYSAKALEEICHREPPYIETREGFPEGKACHKVMDAEKISSYYGKVVQKYKIRLSDMSNIKVYLSIILSY